MVDCDYAMSAISLSMSLTIINGDISTFTGVDSASILSKAIGSDKEATDNIRELLLLVYFAMIIIGPNYTMNNNFQNEKTSVSKTK